MSTRQRGGTEQYLGGGDDDLQIFREKKYRFGEV